MFLTQLHPVATVQEFLKVYLMFRQIPTTTHNLPNYPSHKLSIPIAKEESFLNFSKDKVETRQIILLFHICWVPFQDD